MSFIRTADGIETSHQTRERDEQDVAATNGYLTPSCDTSYDDKSVSSSVLPNAYNAAGPYTEALQLLTERAE